MFRLPGLRQRPRSGEGGGGGVEGGGGEIIGDGKDGNAVGRGGEGAGGESYGARAGAARAGAPKAAKLGSSSSSCRRCYFSVGAVAAIAAGKTPRLSAQHARWHARRQRLLRKRGEREAIEQA